MLCRDGVSVDPEHDAKALTRVDGLDEDCNVMFVTDVGADSFRLQPWERGGTGATRACGSGAIASAAALWSSGALQATTVRARCPGGTLHVSRDASGCYDLHAAAATVFEGVWD